MPEAPNGARTLAEVAEVLRGLPRDKPVTIRMVEPQGGAIDAVATNAYVGRSMLTGAEAVIIECGPIRDRFLCAACGHYAKKDGEKA